MRRRPVVLGPLAVAAALAACEPSGSSPVTAVDAGGSVQGIAFLDRNGNGTLEPSVDRVAPGTRLRLSFGAPGGPAAAVLVAGPDGAFPLTAVPAGTYSALGEAVGVGDSIVVAAVDSARFTVGAGETATVAVQLRYRGLSLAEVRRAPAGLRVTLDAVALHAWATFGDSTLHVADATGYLRLRGVMPTNVAAGDSVRVVATTGSRDGLPTLVEGAVFGLGRALAPPVPVALPVAEARGARGGSLDAALVAVTGTAERDPVPLTNGDVRVTIREAGASMQVLLDREAQVGSTPPVRTGANVAATGLLVPSGSPGEWVLKPRASADLRVSYPLTPIAEARRAPAGSYLRIRGTVRATGTADGTVLVEDASGSLRVRPSGGVAVVVGDPVEAHGEMREAAGEPVMQGAQLLVVAAP